MEEELENIYFNLNDKGMSLYSSDPTIAAINPPYRLEIRPTFPKVILFNPESYSKEKEDLSEKLESAAKESFRKKEETIYASLN